MEKVQDSLSFILPLGELGVNLRVYNFYKDALAGMGGNHVGRQDLEESSDEDCLIDRRSDVQLHGRQISLVELLALSRLSEEEVMCQVLRCVSLCDPGVHVFLLIIPDAPLNGLYAWSVL
ncbi:hypothetical protein DPX16_0582 [Anabarilius grahami]|uniref:Uncharacterized protein n=1 Tax=Anabarilius grahami TaxID=495550 RepID=A0A3N0XNV4_ANAGA|nr:hypothetical protein DPX16_0582 [Anabarilius grahami]